MKRSREGNILPNQKYAETEIPTKKREREENTQNLDMEKKAKKAKKEDENYRKFLKEEEERLNKYFSIICL
jgi:hypothetical protein